MPIPIQEEIVTIVDEKNRVVGAAPRSRMRADGLPHRATYILVFNDEGELFVQKRTTGKDIYPGYYDVATGGVVLAGESYEDAAERELVEELGITGVRLRGHFDFFHEDAGNRVWGRVFPAFTTVMSPCRKKKWRAAPSTLCLKSWRSAANDFSRRMASTFCSVSLRKSPRRPARRENEEHDHTDPRKAA